jgi:ABC-2 type transport system ATP-binding protein
MERLGHFAVDIYGETGMRTEFFPDREAAAAFVAKEVSDSNLRRVNLEDAFLSMTGTRVHQKEEK